MKGKMIQRIMAGALAAVMVFTLAGCGTEKKDTKTGKTVSGEKVTIRILENDTAKKSGYLEVLIKSFNEAYKDKGIEAVDANMEEYTDLATNGPYGYGPDVIYQANDQIMTYAEDKHILPVEVDKLDCYEQIPEIAWDAYRIVVDGKTYYCGVPVNIPVSYTHLTLPTKLEV